MLQKHEQPNPVVAWVRHTAESKRRQVMVASPLRRLIGAAASSYSPLLELHCPGLSNRCANSLHAPT